MHKEVIVKDNTEVSKAFPWMHIAISINEVMYESGYNDTKAFRYTLKKISGVSFSLSEKI